MEPTALEFHRSRRDPGKLFRVVAHHQHGRAVPPEIAKDFTDHGGAPPVESGQRLVEQEDARGGQQRRP